MGLVTPATPMAEISSLTASNRKSVKRKFVELPTTNVNVQFERLEYTLRGLNRPKTVKTTPITGLQVFRLQMLEVFRGPAGLITLEMVKSGG